MIVVLDTNVVVSRFLSPHGPPARIFDLWEQELFEVVVSEHILAEYERALGYDRVASRLRLTPPDISELVGQIRRLAIVIDDVPATDVELADEDDRKFINCAIAANADIIVSGDPDLLDVKVFRDVHVLRPVDFLRLFPQD